MVSIGNLNRQTLELIMEGTVAYWSSSVGLVPDWDTETIILIEGIPAMD